MRVALLVPSSVAEPPDHELGPSRAVRNLTRALAVVDGLEVLAMNSRLTPGGRQSWDLDGFRYVRYWVGWGGRVLRDFQPSILQTFSTTATNAVGIWTAATAHRLGAKWVDTVLGLVKLESQYGYSHRPQSFLFERQRLRGSDCTVFPSAFARQAASEALEKPLRKADQVIPLGIGDEWFDHGTWDSPATRRSPEPRLDVVSVGVIAPHKGQDILLDAFKRANVAGRIRFVGPERDHHYGARLRGMAGNLGSSKTVEYTGFLTQAQTIDELKHANVFALLSRFDVFPSAVVEAMALGHAPIVTRSVGVSELVADGTSGYIVEDGDADAVANILEEIAANPEAHRLKGDRARALARELRWPIIAQRYAAIYRDLVRAAS